MEGERISVKNETDENEESQHIENGYVVENTPEAAMADDNFDLIMNASLAKNEYPRKIIDDARASSHCPIALRVCTDDLWEQYKDVVSSGPAKWTLARAINTGKVDSLYCTFIKLHSIYSI